jgi:hypothetical protein
MMEPTAEILRPAVLPPQPHHGHSPDLLCPGSAAASGLTVDVTAMDNFAFIRSSSVMVQDMMKNMGYEQGDPSGDIEPMVYDPDLVSQLISSERPQFEIPDPVSDSQKLS